MKMQSVENIVKANCSDLEKSNRTFEDIYNIIFNQDGIMAETSDDFEIVEYSYETARKNINILSNAIYRKTGSTGEFIALSCENRVEWIILFWSILKSGNKPYLVNLSQPAEFTKSILDTLNVKHVISYNQTENYGRNQLIYNDLIATETSSDKFNLPFEDEMALSTSGTTLNQKICIYTGKEMSEQILNSDQLIERNPSFKKTYNGKIKILSILPLYHIFGFEATYLWFAFFRAIMVFPHNLASKTVLNTIRLHGITHIFAVPLFWNTIEKNVLAEISKSGEKQKNKFEKYSDLSLALQNISPAFGVKVASAIFKKIRESVFGNSVNFCITGGSYINESTLKFFNALGYQIFNGYGMSELGISTVDLSKKPKDRIVPSIGKPFNSVEFKVSENQTLLVKGSSVCKKMIINGELLEITDWFDTGDIIDIDEDGKYYIKGRMSDLVISSNGENLNPQLVEEALDLSFVKKYSVLGDEKNENLILVVQVNDFLPNETIKILVDKISECVSSLPVTYRIKEVYLTTDSLIADGDIKVSRKKLRNRITSGNVKLTVMSEYSETSRNTDNTKLKNALRAIFAETLNISADKIADNSHLIDDLGGTSFEYFSIVSEIEGKFDIKFDYVKDGTCFTINDLARAIEEQITI